MGLSGFLATESNFRPTMHATSRHGTPSLKAHCRGADWINKTFKKKRIRQGSVISLYSEIHEDDNDLIPVILETKYDPRA